MPHRQPLLISQPLWNPETKFLQSFKKSILEWHWLASESEEDTRRNLDVNHTRIVPGFLLATEVLKWDLAKNFHEIIHQSKDKLGTILNLYRCQTTEGVSGSCLICNQHNLGKIVKVVYRHLQTDFS